MPMENLRPQTHEASAVGGQDFCSSHDCEGSIEEEFENGRQERFARLAGATALNKVLERPHITGWSIRHTNS